ALPGFANQLGRKVIGKPAARAGEQLERADIGLFAQLTQGCPVRVFARIDAPLRHLPGVNRVDLLWAAGAAPDEDAASAIDHHGANAWPIGQGCLAAQMQTPATKPQVDFGFLMIMLTG